MKYVSIPRLTVNPARWPFFAYLKETFGKCLSCSKNRKQMPIVPKKKRTRNYDKYFRHGERFSRRHENCWNFDKRLTSLSILVIFVILPRLSPNTKYLWLRFLKHLLFLGKRWSYTVHGVLRLPEVIEGNRVITATTLRKIYLQRQDQSTDSMWTFI